MSITEKTLRPIVQAWLQGQGYYVAHEVMLTGRFCDLIGCKWQQRIGRRIPAMREIMAVELKISDIRGVLYQAKNNKWSADFSYAAMPLRFCRKMRSQSLKLFGNLHVGLLGVSVEYGVDIIVAAPRNEIVYDPLVCRRLWNFKLRHCYVPSGT